MRERSNGCRICSQLEGTWLHLNTLEASVETVGVSETINAEESQGDSIRQQNHADSFFGYARFNSHR